MAEDNDQDNKSLVSAGVEMGEGEGNRLVRGRELETPRQAAERELVGLLAESAQYIRHLLSTEPISRDAALCKEQRLAAFEVFDRVHAIASDKPAANSGAGAVSLSAAAYRKVLQKRMLKAKVVELQPIAAEEKQVDQVEMQPSAAVPDASQLGVIPR